MGKEASDPTSGASTAQEIIPEIEKQLESELPNEFGKLPEGARRELVTKITEATLSVTHSTWDGAYPPPAILEGYESIQPGLADRIFKMAEDELAHRQQMEKRLASYMSSGQWFGFILALAAIVGSVFLIYSDKQIAGGMLGGAVLIPLVAMFVKGQFDIAERNQKKQPDHAPTPPLPQPNKRKQSKRKPVR